MKLKDQTFAIIAEKKDSISHKWFNKNIKKHNKEQHVFWEHKNQYYLYDKGVFIRCTENRPKDVIIYTESEFEALLKSEQENERFDQVLQKGIDNSRLNEPLTAKVLNDPKQITIPYNLAIEYLAERLNVDKGIIKIEMP